jgi:poly(hydroxyalkanoate) granule-associated protein
MTNVQKVERLVKEMSDELMLTSRQVWLAGLGVVGMAGNTAQAVLDMVIEEGVRLQKVERKRLVAVVDQIGDRVAQVNKMVDDTVQSTTKVALSRLGLPSRKDVTELAKRVDLLSAKVEAMRGSRRRTAYAR